MGLWCRKKKRVADGHIAMWHRAGYFQLLQREEIPDGAIRFS